MHYISTRGQTEPVNFSQAVALGLAPDGGLFLPQELPLITPFLKTWEGLSYEDLAHAFFQLFFTDLETETLKDLVKRSYQKFDHPKIAPLRRLHHNLYLLELFHGPTLAFKDFGLQLLGNFYEEQIRTTGKPLNILGATSGDTGAAAIYGLLDKIGVNIFILYPNGRISTLQERQMACTEAKNVFALAIDGSFDEAQGVLKEIFEDLDFRRRYGLSAVNSINLARIIAQCVYYLYAWFHLPAAQRDSVEFVVPTGNFGNILAGWLTQKMGLPVKSFKVATNRNDILHRLFQTGVYALSQVQPSLAPSMDIQVASNFERFLYYREGCDPQKVCRIMNQYKHTGLYRFEPFDRDTFTSSHATDEEIIGLIGEVYEKFGYIVDPHTACGFKMLDRDKTSVVLATAHPAKFPHTILKAIGKEPKAAILETLKERKIVKYTISADKATIQNFIREHAVRGV